MAGFEVTTPDNIAKPVNGSPASIVQVGQTMGDSVQAALNKRERYDFVWPTSAERDAETGMTQGSRGYQVDIKSEYVYDNSQWRLAISYVEFANSGFAVPNVTYTAFSSWSVDSTLSTDSGLVSVVGNRIRIINPGVYSLSITTDGNNNLGNGGFVDFTYDLAHMQIIAIGGFVAGVATCTVPFLHVTSSNTDLYAWIYQNSGSGAAVSSSATNRTVAMRIGRFG